MKKSFLLSITGITIVAVTATTLYAQTVAGSSIVDKMKAAARNSFALSADLNPGQTGYESAPVSGKKTGNMLTAAEWNRMLEIVAQGGIGTGGSGGTGAPIFHYCTNAQSLDSTNAPCYGASRNQGLGDGRYRVVSCHIIGSTGHESINSQLLNFGRTGLAAMQNKWNSLYTDSQWQLCIDGSVLVADTQGIASGGGAGAGAGATNSPILCSKSGNSGKANGYVGSIVIPFSATDCAGGVLPDVSNYIGVVQGVRVCGGIEHFVVTGTSVQVWSNNLCKWASGKDYDFDVLYIHK